MYLFHPTLSQVFSTRQLFELVSDIGTFIHECLIRIGKARTNLLKNRLLEDWTQEKDDEYYSDSHLTMYDIQERLPPVLFDDEHYTQEIIISTKPI